MVASGMTLPDLLAAATLGNARQLGLDEDYGTIEPGKVANLLLLEENPLETVEAWDTLRFVILHGRLIVRDSLAARPVETAETANP